MDLYSEFNRVEESYGAVDRQFARSDLARIVNELLVIARRHVETAKEEGKRAAYEHIYRQKEAEDERHRKSRNQPCGIF